MKNKLKWRKIQGYSPVYGRPVEGDVLVHTFGMSTEEKMKKGIIKKDDAFSTYEPYWK